MVEYAAPMKRLNYLPVPASSRLLNGITTSEAKKLYAAIGVTAWHFDKGEMVIRQGDPFEHYWLIVSGEVHAYTDHGNGKRTVAMSAGHGETFGLLFAYSDLKCHPTHVMAMTDTVLLKFPKLDLFAQPEMVSRNVTRHFVTNLVSVISQAAFRARFRVFVVAHKTIEDRILAYLKCKSMFFGKQGFDIPLDRQELADFLDVDRCSLSAALGRLRDRGIISFRKKHFELLAEVRCNEY